jgi:hypothetical protein
MESLHLCENPKDQMIQHSFAYQAKLLTEEEQVQKEAHLEDGCPDWS